MTVKIGNHLKVYSKYMEKDIKMIKISDIDEGPIRHPVLPDDLLERIKVFTEILSEVDKTTLEASIDGFKRDANPEKEVIIWERIANTYQLYIAHNAIEALATRKEVFSILLGVSMGMEEWDNIKHLTKDQINHLVLNYKGL